MAIVSGTGRSTPSGQGPGTYRPVTGHDRAITTACLAAVLLMASGDGSFAATASFRCADGASFRATFSAGPGAGLAVLSFAGSSGEITLEQVLSADGGRYANGDAELWVKGRTGTLIRGGRSTVCEATE
jgi:membrane-bound inhibitor of C-type lysozyme